MYLTGEEGKTGIFYDRKTGEFLYICGIEPNRALMTRILYPIGNQSFEKIRDEKRLYIDKTALIYQLVNFSSYIFLSRPRRFGKSLLLTTLKAYFEGKKDLFEGLEISRKEKEWKKYPVLLLSFANLDANNPNSLKSILEYQFRLWEEEYAIEPCDLDYAQRFQNIILRIYQKSGSKVVILIDEYDHALINTIHDKETHELNKELLKSVYSNLKDMDAYIRFGMLTGVTRFSKAGIFSGLNNLTDVTFNKEFSTICGFTETEIRHNIWSGVEKVGQNYDVSGEEALQMLKSQYDGYHFSADLVDIYNPFSLLNALYSGDISNYWINSGSPTFLVEKLKESRESFYEIFHDEADTTDLSEVDVAFTSPVALLYQTGYLTIKGYNQKDGLYKLGLPNKEVREGFFSLLLAEMVDKERRKTSRETKIMKECLEEGNVEGFMERLEAFCAGIPYLLTCKAPEIYFENNLFVIFTLMGFDVKVEEETSNGRMDLCVKTDNFIYIFEIKVDQNPLQALTQINRKEYALKYKFDKRKLIKIGVDFSSEKRNINGWKEESVIE